MSTPKNGFRSKLAVGSDRTEPRELENLKTTKEAAAFLKLSETYLRYLTSNGKIPFYKFGRQNRYQMKDLLRLIQPGSREV